MGRLIAFFIIIACFLIFSRSREVFSINQARKKGLYPQKGKATMWDVRHLITQGERELAIRVYREIFETNYKEAKKAVEELESSISKNNIDSEEEK